MKRSLSFLLILFGLTFISNEIYAQERDVGKWVKSFDENKDGSIGEVFYAQFLQGKIPGSLTTPALRRCLVCNDKIKNETKHKVIWASPAPSLLSATLRPGPRLPPPRASPRRPLIGAERSLAF